MELINKTSEWEVLTPDGFKSFDGVRITLDKEYYYKIKFDCGIILECSSDHQVKLVDNTFIEIEKLQEGAFVQIKGEMQSRIIKKDKIEKNIPVYDLLNVGEKHEYFTNDIISHNCLLCDEFAYLPINLADDFIASVFPTISSSAEAKIIMVSTPNGMNHFYNIWKKAEKGKNSFKPFKVNWRDVPGRDDNWLEQMKKDIGEVRVNAEFLCQFLGSSRTLINAHALEALDSEQPIDITVDGLHIYEHPKPKHTYVLGVDVGKGVQGDNSVIQVLDLSVTPIQQVAVFGDNNLNPRKFGKYVVKVAKMYNNAFVMIENNAEGYAAAQTIWNEEGYDNLVDADTGKKDIGIRATSKSKSRAVTTLKDIVEDKCINIVDNNTIYELSRFTEVSPGRFAGDDNEHDDYVTSLYWALYITTLEQYYDQEEFTNIRVKQKDDEEEEVYEEPLEVYSDDDFDDMALFERELLRG